MKNRPRSALEIMVNLPPLEAPPGPPQDLEPEGAECWKALTSRMRDWAPDDLPILKMACEWHQTFTKAARDAREAKDPGEQWKFQTCQAMASKQFSQLCRLLGLAKRTRRVPSKLERAQQLKELEG